MKGHGCWDRKPAVSTPGSKNRSKSEGVGGCGEFRVGGMSVAFIGPVVVDMDLGMSSACVWCILSQ